MSKINKNLYRAALARCGKTQRELAHELDMCESTLVAKVKKNTLTVGDAEKMISILRIENPTEIFFAGCDTSQVTREAVKP